MSIPASILLVGGSGEPHVLTITVYPFVEHSALTQASPASQPIKIPSSSAAQTPEMPFNVPTHSLHFRARPMFKDEMYRGYEILILVAASHLVPNTFSPQTFGSPQLVPKNKQSPNRPIWSPWTYGPQDKWSPWTNGPQNLLVVSKSGLNTFFNSLS